MPAYRAGLKPLSICGRLAQPIAMLMPLTRLARPSKVTGVATLEVLTQAHYHRNVVNDLERCEYFVPVNWIHTVPQNEAVKEVGLFGNQNTVCRPTTPKWRWTIERLKERFRVT